MREKHTDDEKIAALIMLKVNGGNVNKTAEQLEIPVSTLVKWNQMSDDRAIKQLAEMRKTEMADKFQQIASLCLSIVEAKVGNLKPKEAAWVASLCVDKMLLLRGEATVINETKQNEKLELLKQRYASLEPNAAVDAGGDSGREPVCDQGPVPEAN